VFGPTRERNRVTLREPRRRLRRTGAITTLSKGTMQ
jgi:hypothetical protein